VQPHSTAHTRKSKQFSSQLASSHLHKSRKNVIHQPRSVLSMENFWSFWRYLQTVWIHCFKVCVHALLGWCAFHCYLNLFKSTFLILCWVSCVMQPEKMEIFSVIGLCQCQFSPPPPKDFCGGLRSAGNWYGLWPRVHDAQAPNGINTQVQANLDSGWDILFIFFTFFRNVFEFADKAQFAVHL